MSAAELKAATTLSLVFFLRMMPLFMVLPVLALAAESYNEATPQLLGLALGIYGLTQASLQVPFGMWSDRWGRKPIITLGLIIFILGSLLAATSDSIYGLIAGRALQGAGAVAASIMALAADLTTPQHRTKAMALIGMSIGGAFSLAFICGPLLFPHIGINGLFYIGAGMAALAIILLWFVVPKPEIQQTRSNMTMASFKSVLFDNHLIKLNFSIFSSHLILMANFVVTPLAIHDLLNTTISSDWQVYLIVIFASLLIMVPFIILSSRLNKERLFFTLSIFLIAISQAGLAFSTHDLSSIVILLIVFFGAFNYMEAFLPSEVSKTSKTEIKGTALGVYSSSQFIGIFIGGLAGGFFHQQYGDASVYLFCLIISLIWFAITLFFSNANPIENKLEEDAV
ncbi:MAG: MFS transporter [Proteobacteria bacterium]|nr:MFS transporter [Pseudomonadota bacterium]